MTWTLACLMVFACTCVCWDGGATVCLREDGLSFGKVYTNESGKGMGMNEMTTCVAFISTLLIRTMPSPGLASDVYHALGPTDLHLPSTPSLSRCIQPNPTVDVERPHGWLHVVVPPRALACACFCFFVCACLSKSWFPPFLPPSTPFIFCPPFPLLSSLTPSLCYLLSPLRRRTRPWIEIPSTPTDHELDWCVCVRRGVVLCCVASHTYDSMRRIHHT